MSQVIKRKSTPNTREGQYMCPECGKIFDTKKEVDTHIHNKHPYTIHTLHAQLHTQ